MAQQIKGDYAQTVVSQCVQLMSPCSRTSGKAMQQNERLCAVSSFTTQFNSKPYTIHLHKRSLHIHFLSLTLFFLSGKRPQFHPVLICRLRDLKCVLTTMLRI